MSYKRVTAKEIIKVSKDYQDTIRNELVGECRNRDELQLLSNKITAVGAVFLKQLEEEGDFSEVASHLETDPEDEEKVAGLVTRTIAGLIELGMAQVNMFLAEQSLEWDVDE